MYVRVKEQGGTLAFVLVKSVREGSKVRQKFVCHLGSFPKGHDFRTLDQAYCRFLQTMHAAVGRLNLRPLHKRNLYGKISDALRKARRRHGHGAKRRL